MLYLFETPVIAIEFITHVPAEAYCHKQRGADINEKQEFHCLGCHGASVKILFFGLTLRYDHYTM